jgi:hypothetical protein
MVRTKRTVKYSDSKEQKKTEETCNNQLLK